MSNPEYGAPLFDTINTDSATEFVKKYAQRATEAALEKIQERFEKAANPENNLEYHRQDHTHAVLRRVEMILNTLKASLTDTALGKIAAAFHDTVQNWEEMQDANTGVLKRKRFAGKNETSSAEEASVFMNEVNQDGQNIFSEDDIKMVMEAIMVTVPGFNGKTVIQPGLQKDSPLVVLAMALADLGAAGIDGAEQFLSEGDANFREENLDISRAIATGNPIAPDQTEKYRQRMLGWTKFQPVFAQGRQEAFENEISGLPDNQKESMRSLFNKFDESIKASQERIAKRESMTFEELVKDMGYSETPIMPA